MAMAMGLISGVVSAIGAMATASAQAQAAKHNAAVAEMNAKAARHSAAADAKKARRIKQRQQGRVIATVAANGLNMTGSALDVLGDNNMEFEMDIHNIVREGEARNADFTNKAEGHRLEAKHAMTAGVINAFSGILGGFGQALRLS